MNLKKHFLLSFILPLFCFSQGSGLLSSLGSFQGGNTVVNGAIVLNQKKIFPSAIGAAADMAPFDWSTTPIYTVDNANIDGTGSYFEQVKRDVRRIVIVRASGVVSRVNYDINASNDYGEIMILGQFAPGDGLVIRHGKHIFDQLGDIVIRQMTYLGDQALGCTVNTNCFDPLNFFRIPAGKHVYVENNTLMYGVDQFLTYNVDHTAPGDKGTIRTTTAFNLFAEGDPTHSTAMIYNTYYGADEGNQMYIGQHSAMGNYWYNISHRITANTNVLLDYESYNNYFYNWRARLARMNSPTNWAWHRNVGQAGPETVGIISDLGHKMNYGNDWLNNDPTLYVAFNSIDGLATDTSSDLQSGLVQFFDDESGTVHGLSILENRPVPNEYFTQTLPFSFNVPSYGFLPTSEVKDNVLANAGRNRGINADGSPYYGRHDLADGYINAAKNLTGTAYRSTGDWNVPILYQPALYQDTDGDYMPDYFENMHPHLDPSDPSDQFAVHTDWTFPSFSVVNNAGYTNLEICAEYYAGGFDRLYGKTNEIN